MQVISKCRGGGKTTEMINKVRRNPKSIIICHDINEKSRLVKKNPDLVNRIFTWDEFNGEKILGRGFEEAHIDNMDLILSRLRIPIKSISITKGDE